MARAHAMRMGMQGQQVCQQPRGWECLALSRDSESAEIAYVGSDGRILLVRTSAWTSHVIIGALWGDHDLS